ncbi:MAG: hypothetical protein KJO34_12170 [Deltaproteobacteria bacterium]|nr:hypothetical protein [Deltaproteobacteria bacterium]
MSKLSCGNINLSPGKDARILSFKFLYLALIIFSIFLTRSALGDELPSYCEDKPGLAGKLTRLGPVMGLGSSVSHGLLARSVSEVVADQLCLGSQGHVFPWYYPASYQKAAKFYYKRNKPGLVIAVDVTYHDMKILEYTSDKKKVLDTLVPALALDCASEFYDCAPDGNDAYVKAENYRPTVILGDIFFENLIDCSQGKPPKGYQIENAKPRPDKLCFEEYDRLNNYLAELVARYPNVHLYPANHFFTSLVKYPNSIFYDEGTRQTFFSRKELTWDGWHPYTDPGSKVFANLIIMYVNRLIQDGKIKGSRIPLIKLANEYFGPPSGLIIIVPETFPPVTKPQIIGPDSQKVPLRFFLSREWAERHGVFSIGKSYFKARALAWNRLGPKPLLIRAQTYSGATIVLSKKDQDMLTSHYRNGIALKGALLLIGDDLNEKKVSREDTFFLNQLDEDKSILEKFSPPMLESEVTWDY